MSKSSKRKLTMAETLRKAIQDSGETVAALARGAGIAQPVLHRFAKGERDLTLDTAERLARYFNLELRPASS
jgi:plasmid maintenance system antidote protein VapI